MRRSALVTVVVSLVLSEVLGWSQPNPADYKRISQCVLVRERRSLVGEKVQITGEFVGGGKFCYKVKKAKINTKEYFCFAVGKACLIRIYIKKDHADMNLLLNLKEGDNVTAYGTFDFMGLDYNYMIVDGISVQGK